MESPFERHDALKAKLRRVYKIVELIDASEAYEQEIDPEGRGMPFANGWHRLQEAILEVVRDA